jgi:hypothetical protein
VTCFKHIKHFAGFYQIGFNIIGLCSHSAVARDYYDKKAAFQSVFFIYEPPSFAKDSFDPASDNGISDFSGYRYTEAVDFKFFGICLLESNGFPVR